MLIAPRAQLGFEGLLNQHENPIGSQATYTAARLIYEWYGAPSQIGVFFHNGAHPMDDLPSEHDWVVVADFADQVQHGRAPRNATEFNTTAYQIDCPFSWSAPTSPP